MDGIHIEGYTVRITGVGKKGTKGENRVMNMWYVEKTDAKQVGSHTWNTSGCKVAINWKRTGQGERCRRVEEIRREDENRGIYGKEMSKKAGGRTGR